MVVVYGIACFLFIISIIGTVVGLIKPSLFKRVLKARANRKVILGSGISLFLVASTVGGLTEPASMKQARLDKERAAQEAALIEQQNKEREEASKPKPQVEEKEVKEEQGVAFGKEQKEDGGIPKGESKVVQAGVEGKKTLTYKVKYEDGKEVSRELVGEAVTTNPVNEVTAIGTYVYVAPKPAPKPAAPKPAPKPSAPASPAPSQGRTGAICKDGWKSTATGRGACSHHGGVDHWLY